MVDFKSTTREGYVSASFKSKVKDKEEKKKKKFDEGALKATTDKGKSKLMGAQGKGTKPNFACFICDCLYFVRECPKKEKLNVIRVGDSDENEGVVTHVNPMCVLNYLVAESGDTTVETSLVDQDLARIDAMRKGKSGAGDLMYEQISVNEQPIDAILDSGTTYTFVVDRLVKALGLRLSSSHISMKAVNSKAHKIASMSYDMLIVLDRWRGKQVVMDPIWVLPQVLLEIKEDLTLEVHPI